MLIHWGRVTHICVSELTIIVQIMACRLHGAKTLSEQRWNIVNWTLGNKLQWNLNRNSNIFIHDNALEHVVCEMAAILSRRQCVNSVDPRLASFHWLPPVDQGHHFTDWPVNQTPEINMWMPRQMDAISQTTFSNAFSWMKIYEFPLKFHWSLFPRFQSTIFPHWFR